MGSELTVAQITELLEKDTTERAMDVVLHYLGYRPRSEAEIRTKLARRGFTEDVTNVVINRLKEQGLIDDIAFAKFWKENRETFSPRSSWLTRQELKQKGIPDEMASQVVDDEGDEVAAYQAALNKVRRLSTDDYKVFRQRLGEYLKRRGFGYGVIDKTIVKIWQEREERVLPDHIL